MADWRLIHGDCLDVLRGMADASVDACVCDPPYGLSDHDTLDVVAALKCWLDGKPYTHGTSGFMGRAWDGFVPGPEVWREVYRVLKPGGHLLAFAGSRTHDLMGIAIRLAGFELRDTVNHAYTPHYLGWVQGQGFPKSHDISKAIDRMAGTEREVVGSKLGRPGYSLADNPGRGVAMAGNVDGSLRNPGAECAITAPATDAAKQWDGWGTALKPALEPILMFRKPLAEPTIAAQVLANGCGGLNIDATRVNGHSYTQEQWTQKGASRPTGSTYGVHRGSDTPLPSGRWPSNLVLSHHPDCQRIGSKRVRSDGHFPKSRTGTHGAIYGGGNGLPRETGTPEHYMADADGMEEVDAWECVDGCPVKALDEQAGVRKSGLLKAGTRPKGQRNTFQADVQGGYEIGSDTFGDTGSASRFFPVFSYEADDFVPFRYCAKASRSERDRGLSDCQPVQLRDDLTDEQRAYVMAELKAAGVVP